MSEAIQIQTFDEVELDSLIEKAYKEQPKHPIDMFKVEERGTCYAIKRFILNEENEIVINEARIDFDPNDPEFKDQDPLKLTDVGEIDVTHCTSKNEVDAELVKGLSQIPHSIDVSNDAQQLDQYFDILQSQQQYEKTGRISIDMQQEGHDKPLLVYGHVAEGNQSVMKAMRMTPTGNEIVDDMRDVDIETIGLAVPDGHMTALVEMEQEKENSLKKATGDIEKNTITQEITL